MSTYEVLKKLIANYNFKFKNGTMTPEQYKKAKESTVLKLDTFLSLDRITSDEYLELMDMFIPENTEN